MKPRTPSRDVKADESLEDSEMDRLLRGVALAPDRTVGGAAPPRLAANRQDAREPRGVSGVRLAADILVAGRFRLERALGEGGMGVVWQATHVVTRKPVALKFLKRATDSDERAVQRFLREARAACAVRHPCVVDLHDVLELEDGSPVMVMELLTGETLAKRLDREATLALPLAEFASIMVHVCSAVARAHGLGIVHRDLKPDNIFLATTHAGITVKVLDFGIAKLTATEGDAANTGAHTGTGALLGTPYYMAPEQLFGERDIDHRADIWALGIICYEALAGVLPTRQENVGQIIKVIVTDATVPLRQRAPHLPEPILNLVERMTERDRARRPADVGEVVAVLTQYTDEPFVPIRALTRVEAPEADRSVHRSVSLPMSDDNPGGPLPALAGTARGYSLAAPEPRDARKVPQPAAAVRTRASRIAGLAVVTAVGVGALMGWGKQLESKQPSRPPTGGVRPSRSRRDCSADTSRRRLCRGRVVTPRRGRSLAAQSGTASQAHGCPEHPFERASYGIRPSVLGGRRGRRSPRAIRHAPGGAG